MERQTRYGELEELTGIYHKRAFNARLESALSTASPEQPLSLLHLDLDHFKGVNDTRGHLCGDHVLRHVASLLPSEGGVVPARGGGDEFLLLVPGLDETASLHYAQRLCEIIATRPAVDCDQQIVVTVSIGVSTTEEPVAAADLRAQADRALYEAKGSGRNRAVHFRAFERTVVDAGGDVRIQSFETMQRVVSERAADFIARRRRQLLEALQNQADQDRVTGLFNRGYLDRRVLHACREARSSSHPLCAALIDVDHFGAINKTHGWPTGDLTLRGIADLVRQNVRDNDWVARYGGEEIAVILPGASQEVAVQVVERVRQAVAAQTFHNVKGEPFSVTISGGVVELQPGEPTLAMWQRLSEKLLAAKNTSRNRVEA